MFSSKSDYVLKALHIAKASDILQVLTKRVQGFGIELFKRYTSILCPAREALDATNQVGDTAALVSTFFEPSDERIKLGASGSGTILLQC
jgi:hypothetical protein